MDPKDNLVFQLGAILMILTLFASTRVAHAETDKVLAVVEGRNITQSMLDNYAKRRGMPADMDPSKQRAAMMEELINRELIYLDGIKNKIQEQANVKAEIENQRVNIVASAMLQKQAATKKISDAELKKAYDEKVKKMGSTEYHARHILLENEEDAKEVIAQLKKGADFSKLAQEKSTGPSGPGGGDLGWFQSGQMVKEFSDEVAKLKNGEYSQTPVKSQFGWHVILRVDDRALAPPLFDTLKEQLRMRLQNQHVEQYIDSLRKKSAIAKNF